MTLDTAKMLVAHLSPLWLGRFLKRRPEADQQHGVNDEPVTRKVQDAGPPVDSWSSQHRSPRKIYYDPRNHYYHDPGIVIPIISERL